MAGIPPIALAVMGAGVGAITNPDDPLKGAILGGAAGFAGGTALGAAGAGAAGGAAGGTGLTAATAGQSATMGLGQGMGAVASTAPAYTAPLAASTVAPYAAPAGITLGSGLTPTAAAAAAPAGITGAQAMRGIQMAQMLNPGGGTRTAYAPPQLNRGRQVDSASPVLGLLQTPPVRRRPMSLLG